mmetsp:Transcript_42229/g.106527  ORF Transcript_42229/g.106527 Transcript_42229/m.106527 type:complete len:259 (+) Transcript_42229:1288-2064(+)
MCPWRWGMPCACACRTTPSLLGGCRWTWAGTLPAKGSSPWCPSKRAGATRWGWMLTTPLPSAAMANKWRYMLIYKISFSMPFATDKRPQTHSAPSREWRRLCWRRFCPSCTAAEYCLCMQPSTSRTVQFPSPPTRVHTRECCCVSQKPRHRATWQGTPTPPRGLPVTALSRPLSFRAPRLFPLACTCSCQRGWHLHAAVRPTQPRQQAWRATCLWEILRSPRGAMRLCANGAATGTLSLVRASAVRPSSRASWARPRH